MLLIFDVFILGLILLNSLDLCKPSHFRLFNTVNICVVSPSQYGSKPPSFLSLNLGKHYKHLISKFILKEIFQNIKVIKKLNIYNCVIVTVQSVAYV